MRRPSTPKQAASIAVAAENVEWCLERILAQRQISATVREEAHKALQDARAVREALAPRPQVGASNGR